MRTPMVFLSLLALASCTSTAQVQSDVSSRWIGQPLDAFVVKHGVPQATFEMADGRTVVEWSDVHGIAKTGAPAQTLIGLGTPVQGGSYQLTCKIRFVISRSGTIEKASIVGDTIGRWNTSRCAEVLK